MTDTGTAEPPEVTDEQSADIKTVAAVLEPVSAEGGFSLAPGERDGDVVVRTDGRFALWLIRQAEARLREASVRVREEDDHPGLRRIVAQLWPYDADRRDPLTALRIPVVTTASPQKAYLAALFMSEPPVHRAIWPSVRPTDAEALMLASYISYRCEDYTGSWRAKMLAEPFDMDGTPATRIFRKRPDGGWCYRLDTWESGYFWAPPEFGDDKQTLSLEHALDSLIRYGAREIPRSWLDWKAAHPEAFGEVSDGN